MRSGTLDAACDRGVRRRRRGTPSPGAPSCAARVARCATTWSTGVRGRVPDAVLRGRRTPSRPAARQRPLHLPRLRGRLAALPARLRRHRGVHRVGVPGGRAAARPRAAGDGRRRGRTPAVRCGSRSGAPSTAADVDALARRPAAAVGRERGPRAGAGPRRRGRWPMRVLAALSGGVDSAVAAARAVDAGHDVVGVHMALSRTRDQFRTGSRGCCSIEDAGDARRAADVLGIPYYVWDLSERFEETVVADFLSPSTRPAAPRTRACAATSTSSSRPCSTRRVALGFDAVATGPLRADRDRTRPTGTVASCTARRTRQGPVATCSPSMGPSGWRGRCSRSATSRPRSEVRAEAAARGLSRVGEAGLLRHLLRRRRRHPRLPALAAGVAAGRDRRRLDGAVLGRARRRLRVHRRAAQGPGAGPCRPPTAGRGTSSRRAARRPTAWSSVRRSC